MTKFIFTQILVVTVAHLSVAQQPSAIDSSVVDTTQIVKKIEVDEVEVIKAFEVTLGEARRIGIGPKLEKVMPVDKSYTYDITIVPADITYADPIIKPLAISPDPKANLDHFYAKLGYGMLKSPYADLSFFRNVAELYSFTIDAHHYSLDNSSNLANQKMSESRLSINGDYLLGENMVISAKLFGNVDQRQLYNELPVIVQPGDDLSRSINIFGGGFGIANAEPTKAGIIYDANIGLVHTALDDKYIELLNQDKELALSFDGNLTKKIGDHLSLFLVAESYLDRINTERGDTSLATVDGNVGFSLSKGSFTLQAAADVISDRDGTSTYVDAELSVAVAPGIQVFVGADQELLRNNLSPTLSRNPFVMSSVDLLNNTVVQRLYSGLRGKLLSRLTFDALVAYEDIADQYYFTGASTNPALEIAYQDAKNIAIDANVEFMLSDVSSVGGRLSHNFYDPADTEELYNLPTYSYEAYAKIGIFENKLQMKGSLALQDAVFYIDSRGVEATIEQANTLTDLSIELDYFLTNSIAIWARGNNLLDNRYQRFAGYPTVGLQALGGIIFKF